MSTRTITKTLSTIALGATVFAGLSGTASAQTREHILLARQVGVPAVAEGSAELTYDDSDATSARVNIRWEKLTVP